MSLDAKRKCKRCGTYCEADTVGNQDHRTDSLLASTPREDTLARGAVTGAARARASDRVIPRSGSKRLEESHGVVCTEAYLRIRQFSAFMNGTHCSALHRYPHCSTLRGTKD